MNTREVLWNHIDEHELCPGARSFDDWLHIRWFRIKVSRWAVPVLPMCGLHNALAMHDLHHLLTGYDTSLVGEGELAAWELASGGCGWNLFFWLDRLSVIVPAICLIPWRVFPAIRRGVRCRNLYRRDRDSVLAMDFDRLRAQVDPSDELRARRPSSR